MLTNLTTNILDDTESIEKAKKKVKGNLCMETTPEGNRFSSCDAPDSEGTSEDNPLADRSSKRESLGDLDTEIAADDEKRQAAMELEEASAPAIRIETPPEVVDDYESDTDVDQPAPYLSASRRAKEDYGEAAFNNMASEDQRQLLLERESKFGPRGRKLSQLNTSEAQLLYRDFRINSKETDPAKREGFPDEKTLLANMTDKEKEKYLKIKDLPQARRKLEDEAEMGRIVGRVWQEQNIKTRRKPEEYSANLSNLTPDESRMLFLDFARDPKIATDKARNRQVYDRVKDTFFSEGADAENEAKLVAMLTPEEKDAFNRQKKRAADKRARGNKPYSEDEMAAEQAALKQDALDKNIIGTGVNKLLHAKLQRDPFPQFRNLAATFGDWTDNMPKPENVIRNMKPEYRDAYRRYLEVGPDKLTPEESKQVERALGDYFYNAKVLPGKKPEKRTAPKRPLDLAVLGTPDWKKKSPEYRQALVQAGWGELSRDERRQFIQQASAEDYPEEMMKQILAAPIWGNAPEEAKLKALKMLQQKGPIPKRVLNQVVSGLSAADKKRIVTTDAFENYPDDLKQKILQSKTWGTTPMKDRIKELTAIEPVHPNIVNYLADNLKTKNAVLTGSDVEGTPLYPQGPKKEPTQTAEDLAAEQARGKSGYMNKPSYATTETRPETRNADTSRFDAMAVHDRRDMLDRGFGTLPVEAQEAVMQKAPFWGDKTDEEKKQALDLLPKTMADMKKLSPEQRRMVDNLKNDIVDYLGTKNTQQLKDELASGAKGGMDTRFRSWNTASSAERKRLLDKTPWEQVPQNIKDSLSNALKDTKSHREMPKIENPEDAKLWESLPADVQAAIIKKPDAFNIPQTLKDAIKAGNVSGGRLEGEPGQGPVIDEETDKFWNNLTADTRAKIIADPDSFKNKIPQSVLDAVKGVAPAKVAELDAVTSWTDLPEEMKDTLAERAMVGRDSRTRAEIQAERAKQTLGADRKMSFEETQQALTTAAEGKQELADMEAAKKKPKKEIKDTEPMPLKELPPLDPEDPFSYADRAAVEAENKRAIAARQKKENKLKQQEQAKTQEAANAERKARIDDLEDKVDDRGISTRSVEEEKELRTLRNEYEGELLPNEPPMAHPAHPAEKLEVPSEGKTKTSLWNSVRDAYNYAFATGDQQTHLDPSRNVKQHLQDMETARAAAIEADKKREGVRSKLHDGFNKYIDRVKSSPAGAELQSVAAKYIDPNMSAQQNLDRLNVDRSREKRQMNAYEEYAKKYPFMNTAKPEGMSDLTYNKVSDQLRRLARHEGKTIPQRKYDELRNILSLRDIATDLGPYARQYVDFNASARANLESLERGKAAADVHRVQEAKYKQGLIDKKLAELKHLSDNVRGAKKYSDKDLEALGRRMAMGKEQLYDPRTQDEYKDPFILPQETYNKLKQNFEQRAKMDEEAASGLKAKPNASITPNYQAMPDTRVDPVKKVPMDEKAVSASRSKTANDMAKMYKNGYRDLAAGMDWIEGEHPDTKEKRARDELKARTKASDKRAASFKSILDRLIAARQGDESIANERRSQEIDYDLSQPLPSDGKSAGSKLKAGARVKQEPLSGPGLNFTDQSTGRKLSPAEVKRISDRERVPKATLREIPIENQREIMGVTNTHSLTLPEAGPKFLPKKVADNLHDLLADRGVPDIINDYILFDATTSHQTAGKAALKPEWTKYTSEYTELPDAPSDAAFFNYKMTEALKMPSNSLATVADTLTDNNKAGMPKPYAVTNSPLPASAGGSRLGDLIQPEIDDSPGVKSYVMHFNSDNLSVPAVRALTLSTQGARGGKSKAELESTIGSLKQTPNLSKEDSAKLANAEKLLNHKRDFVGEIATHEGVPTDWVKETNKLIRSRLTAGQAAATYKLGAEGMSDKQVRDFQNEANYIVQATKGNDLYTNELGTTFAESKDVGTQFGELYAAYELGGIDLHPETVRFFNRYKNVLKAREVSNKSLYFKKSGEAVARDEPYEGNMDITGTTFVLFNALTDVLRISLKLGKKPPQAAVDMLAAYVDAIDKAPKEAP